MNDPLDMSGVWYGRYHSRMEPQDNSFIALIEEAAGGFAGTISEPDGSGGIRGATALGRRTGQALYFIKQYKGRWNHAVRYSGRIDGEGKIVSGSWNLDGLVGSFEMQREIFYEDELEDDLSQDIVEPVSLL